MTFRQFLLLLIPSLLWGSSFIFFKELSPLFGPLLTSAIRIVFGSFFMFLFFIIVKRKMPWRGNIKHLAIVGILNSAIPFTLYAYAALYIPSSLSVVLNSTSPMFGAMLGLFIFKERISLNKFIGLLIGIIGVSIVSSIVFVQGDILLYLSIGACLLAALMYATAGIFVKRSNNNLDPYVITFGSLTFAGIGMVILYVILIPFNVHPEIVTDNLLLNIFLLMMFGLLCTSIPYIVYYKLIIEIGPVKALLVTYLMPAFGIVWSIIYGEEFKLVMILGLILILLGIYITSKKDYESEIN